MLQSIVVRFVPWSLFVLAACGGGGGGGGGNPLAVESAAIPRFNTARGQDLYLAPTSGAAAPRLVAEHGSDLILKALPDLVAGRIVYETRSDYGEDLWSVPLVAEDATQKRRLTDITGLQVRAWAPVADRWVVFLADIDHRAPSLWRVDVATEFNTAPQQISTPGAIDVYWQSDWVTADGWACFEEDVTGVNVTRAVAPTTTLTRQTLSRVGAPDTYFLTSVVNYSHYSSEARPLFVGARMLMVEILAVGGGERWNLLCADGPQATPRVLAFDLRYDEIGGFGTSGVSGGSFCYVKSNIGTVAPQNAAYNLYAVRLDGSDGGTVRQLSQFAAGNSIIEYRFYPATDRCYWLNARSTGAGFEYDVYAAAPEAANLSTPVLIGPGGGTSSSGVYYLTPLAGGRVAFVRPFASTSAARTIRVARADVAGSEVGLGPLNLYAVLGADGVEVDEGAWTIPSAPQAIAISSELVGSEYVKSLYRVAPTSSSWSCVPCSVDPVYAIDDYDYWVRAGNRILYGTDAGVSSFDPIAPATQNFVLDGDVPFYSVFPAGNAGAGYLYFDTAVGVYSAWCAGDYPDNVATIHAWDVDEGFGAAGGGYLGGWPYVEDGMGGLGGWRYVETGGRTFFATTTTGWERHSVRVIAADNAGSIDLSQSATAFDFLLGCYRP